MLCPTLFPARYRCLRHQNAPGQTHAGDDQWVEIERFGAMELFGSRESVEGFLHQSVMQEITVGEAEPDKPWQRYSKKHEHVQRRQGAWKRFLSPLDSIEHEKNQDGYQKTNRSFHERSQSRAGGAEQVPIS